MSYQVIARKYRPQHFDEVAGQEVVAATLKNAIRGNRVAHAYLFCGPRGVGKTSMARILSKALNCAKGPTLEPCGQCDLCEKISSGEDLDVIELDGASNRGIDEIRQIRDNVRYTTARGRFKIYIIDEVHMLTKEAFNALLKTLEEPPPHVKFIFATTEVHRIPETILSRCQRFDFKRITNADIVKRLKQICEAEKVEASAEVLQAIARAARGAMRDSQSLLDKVISFGHDRLTLESLREIQGISSFEEMAEFTDLLAARKPAEALLAIDRIFEQGKDIGEFLNQLIDHLRLLMIVRVGGGESPILEVTPEELARLKGQASQFSVDSLLYMIQVLSESRKQVRDSGNSRIPVEVAVVKLAQMEDLRPVTEILKRLADLDLALKKSTGAAPRPEPVGSGTLPSPKLEKSAVASSPPKPPPEARAEAESDKQPVAQLTAASSAAQDKPQGNGNLFEAWPQVIAQVQEKDVLLAHQLQTATIVQVTDRKVRVTFRREDAYHRDTVTAPAKRRIVEDRIRAVTGHNLGLEVVELTGATTPDAAPRPSALEAEPEKRATPPEKKDGVAWKVESAPETQVFKAAAEHPVLKKILDAFEARIVDVRTLEQTQERPKGSP